MFNSKFEQKDDNEDSLIYPGNEPQGIVEKSFAQFQNSYAERLFPTLFLRSLKTSWKSLNIKTNETKESIPANGPREWSWEEIMEGEEGTNAKKEIKEKSQAYYEMNLDMVVDASSEGTVRIVMFARISVLISL
jgi:hypothetical protein